MKLRIILIEEPKAVYRRRAGLNLVQKQKRFARHDRYAVKGRKARGDLFRFQITSEHRNNLFVPLEIHLHEILESLPQLTDGRGFPHLTRTPKQQRLVRSLVFHSSK